MIFPFFLNYPRLFFEKKKKKKKRRRDLKMKEEIGKLD